MMQCFVAVAEESHVSRAAERLGIDQASVSRAIKRLESELGQELLVRRRGRIGELTEAGEMALAAGKQVLGIYRELIHLFGSLEHSPEKTIA
jgi:DNA-binding transcriptional LysR family regulator